MAVRSLKSSSWLPALDYLGALIFPPFTSSRGKIKNVRNAPAEAREIAGLQGTLSGREAAITCSPPGIAANLFCGSGGRWRHCPCLTMSHARLGASSNVRLSVSKLSIVSGDNELKCSKCYDLSDKTVSLDCLSNTVSLSKGRNCLSKSKCLSVCLSEKLSVCPVCLSLSSLSQVCLICLV